MKKALKWIGGLLGIIIVALGIVFFVYVRPFYQKFMSTTTIKVDKDFTLVLGGGGNSGILVGDSTVLVVDTKMSGAAKAFYDTVKQIAGNKKIIVVNTHIHGDHSGGNANYINQQIIAGANYTKEEWLKENDITTFPNQLLKDSVVMKIGDETVTIFALPFNAHTNGDVMVYLHNRKVLFTGDVVLNGQAPHFDKRYPSSVEGYLRAFDLAENKYEIATVVPGHGQNGGKEVIDNFRQYFIDMQTAAADATKKDSLLAKYNDWVQVPMFMSNKATIDFMYNK